MSGKIQSTRRSGAVFKFLRDFLSSLITGSRAIDSRMFFAMGVWVFCFSGEWNSLQATQVEEIIRIYDIFHKHPSMTSQVWLIRKSFALGFTSQIFSLGGDSNTNPFWFV